MITTIPDFNKIYGNREGSTTEIPDIKLSNLNVPIPQNGLDLVGYESRITRSIEDYAKASLNSRLTDIANVSIGYDELKTTMIQVGTQLLLKVAIMYSHKLVTNHINFAKGYLYQTIGGLSKKLLNPLTKKSHEDYAFTKSKAVMDSDDSIRNKSEKIEDYVKNANEFKDGKGASTETHFLLSNFLDNRQSAINFKYFELKDRKETKRVEDYISSHNGNPQVKIKKILDKQKKDFKFNEPLNEREKNDLKIKFYGDKNKSNLTTTDLLSVSVLDEKSDDKDIETYKTKDFVPFYIYDVFNKKYLFFRNTITTMTDSININWNENRAPGKPDPYFDYIGIDENQNVTFSIIINDVQEIEPTFDKINYLQKLCYPDYSTERMIAPLLRITIGDLIKNQLIKVSSLFINPDNNEIGWYFNNKQYYNEKSENEDVRQLPMKIDINIDYTIVFEQLPENKNSSNSLISGIN